MSHQHRPREEQLSCLPVGSFPVLGLLDKGHSTQEISAAYSEVTCVVSGFECSNLSRIASELPAMRIAIRQLVGARGFSYAGTGKGTYGVSFSPKGRACLPSATVELQDNPKPA